MRKHDALIERARQLHALLKICPSEDQLFRLSLLTELVAVCKELTLIYEELAGVNK
ncbi:MAG: hypothetical protein HUU01_14175 [Saprospiraceae bacterium]|nr:hypothetical protein [Saprospiraceae bacterium]